MRKRWLSLLLAVAMVLSMFPAALADVPAGSAQPAATQETQNSQTPADDTAGETTEGQTPSTGEQVQVTTLDELKKAVADAKAGDTIVLTADISVPAGTANNVVVNKAITINGADRTITKAFDDVAGADDYGNYEAVFQVTVPGVTIDNVSFAGLGAGMKDEAAIYIGSVGKGEDITVTDCTFTGAEAAGGAGIIVAGGVSAAINVMECEFTNVKYAAYFNSIGGGSEISGNTVTGTSSTGFYLDGLTGEGFTVSDNTLSNIGTQEYNDPQFLSGIYVAGEGNLAKVDFYNNTVTLAESNTTGYLIGGADGTVVATAGEKGYTSLSAAVTGAASGDTITLLADVQLTEKLVINGKTVVLELNGHTITAKDVSTAGIELTEDSGAALTLKDSVGEGAVQAPDNYSFSLIQVRAGTSMTMESGSIVTTGTNSRSAGTVQVQGQLTMTGGSITGNFAAVTIMDPGATVNVSGGEISGTAYGIAGNGTAGWGGTTINITGGTIKQTADGGGAIYHPQDGTLSISGNPTIEGKSGIQLCAGEGVIANIDGGTVTATGTDNRVSKTGDGFIPDGAAISVVNRSYPGGTPKMTISGGTFTSAQGSAVMAYSWSNETSVSSEWPEATEYFVIDGGEFSSDPSAYLANGYTASQSGDSGNWVVTAQNGVTVDKPSVSEGDTDVSVSVGGNFSIGSDGNDENVSGDSDGSTTVTIDVKATGSVNSVTSTAVTIESATMSTMNTALSNASNALTEVALETDVGTLTIHKDAWNTITEAAKGEGTTPAAVTLTISKEDGDDTIYELTATATVNGVSTDLFTKPAEGEATGGGIEVSVPKPESVSDTVYVYYLGETGTEQVTNAAVQGENVVWTVQHFSRYLIQSTDGEASVTDAETGATTIYTTLADATEAAASGDTITLLKDVTADNTSIGDDTQAVYKLPAGVTFNGGGFTISASENWQGAEGSTTNHILSVENSTTDVTTTITNVTIDGNGKPTRSGIHAYNCQGTVALDGVTVQDCGSVGVQVNGSNVTATDLTTSGNAWGGVNVDDGSPANNDFKFTFNSGSIGEATGIYTEYTGEGAGTDLVTSVIEVKDPEMQAVYMNKDNNGADDVKYHYSSNVAGMGEVITVEENGETIPTVYDTLDRALEDATQEDGSKNLKVQSDVTVDTAITIPEGVTVTVAEGVTVSGAATITNNGALVNEGTITAPVTNEDNGTIAGDGETSTVTGQVVSITKNGVTTSYASLAAAITAAADSDTLTLLANVELGNVTETPITIPNGKNLTITSAEGQNYKISATVTASEATDTTKKMPIIKVEGGAGLTIDNVTLDFDGSVVDSAKVGTGFDVGANGTLSLEGCTVTLDGLSRGVILNGLGQTVTLDGTTLTANDISGNFSNGGDWTIENQSTVSISNVGNHGLSTESLTVNNSTVTVAAAGYVGIVAGNLELQTGANVTVTNSATAAGVKTTSSGVYADKGAVQLKTPADGEAPSLTVAEGATLTLAGNGNNAAEGEQTVWAAVENTTVSVNGTINGNLELGESANSVVVYFVDQDTTSSVVVTLENGSGTVTMPAEAPIREGYTFLGWSADDGQTLYAAGQSASVTAETTFTAQWQAEALADAQAALKTLTDALATSSNRTDWDTVITAAYYYQQAQAFVDGLADGEEKDAAQAELAELTEAFAAVTAIDLSGQNTSENGYAISTGALAPFTGLTELNLSGTGISEFGGLAGLTELTSLDLSENEGVTDDVFGALAEMSKLTDLNLSGTGITDIGGLAGTDAANTLTSLDISDTGVTKLESVWNSEESQSNFPALKELTAQNLELTSISGLVEIATAEDFDTTGVTWDLGGSTLTATGTGDVNNQEHVDAITGVLNSAFTAPTVAKEYTITFDPNGGTVDPTTMVTNADGTLNEMPTPTQAGYNFTGWFTEAEGGQQITATYVFTANTTVYAHWTVAGGGGGGGGVIPGGASVTVGEVENGTITVSPSGPVAGGTTVTLTPAPVAGYELDTLKVTAADGTEVTLTPGSNGTYTFTMPAQGGVTVTATFKPVETQQPLPFEDVADSGWIHDAVRYVWENNLMQGTGDTTFNPHGTMTRSQFVTILWRMEGSPNVGSSSFTDVVDGVWYDQAAAWGDANGIVNGYGDGLFGPNDPITREQMVSMMYRYAEYKGYDLTANGDLSVFADADLVAGWAETSMRWAVGHGLIQGSDNQVNPKGNSERCQVAAVVMRFLENLAK